MAKKNYWAKMPKEWIISGKLKRFKYKNLGVNIAALQIYCCICFETRYKTGLCTLSYDDFQDMCGLSRAMISAGLKLLDEPELNIITKDYKAGHTNRYLLNGYGDPSWAKLPKSPMYGHVRANRKQIDFLYGLNLRNRNNLDALKIYLFLTTIVDKKSKLIAANYTTIKSYTGVHTNKISFALSVLFEFNLLTKKIDPISEEFKYKLTGL